MVLLLSLYADIKNSDSANMLTQSAGSTFELVV